jgi:hypothetical protein
MPVNLLPKELKPKKQIVRISKVLTNISLISLLVFIISAITVTAIYFVVSGRLTSSKESHEDLITQIKALEETEQKIVLIKDRLEKVSNTKAQASAGDQVDVLEDVLGISDGIADISGSSLSEDNVVMPISVDGSLNLTRFLSGILVTGGFKRIEMTSFDLNSEVGYEMEFVFVR